MTEIAFGDHVIAVPSGTRHFETTVKLRQNGVDFEVQIEAGIHLGTGEVYARFQSLDRTTGLPPPVDIGFLPPEDGTGRGQGRISYVIRADAGLAEGTEIRNVASIVFDQQPPTATNQVDPHDPSKGTDPNKEALITIAPATATLTVQTSAGGSVSDPGIGTFTYEWSKQVGLSAVTDAGYTFTGWTSPVCPIADATDPTTTVGLFDNCTVTANFAALVTETPTPTRSATPVTPTPTPTPTPIGDIIGRIRYYSADRPVPSASVVLSGSADQTTATNAVGEYALANVPAGDCKLQPELTDSSKDGISALDAAWVLQQVVGLRQPPFDPLQTLACDVTGNGTITALDAARILQRVVDVIDRFPVAEACDADWAFWPMPLPAPRQTPIPPKMTPGVCQQGAIAFSPLIPPVAGQDFYGIKFGDCTGNWQPPAGGAGAAALLSAEAPRVSLGRPRLGRSGRLRVPVYVQSTTPFHALELELTHDPTALRSLDVRATRSAKGALVRSGSDSRGRSTVALASGIPIANDTAPVLYVEVEPLDATGRGHIALLRAVIDDRLAAMN